MEKETKKSTKLLAAIPLEKQTTTKRDDSLKGPRQDGLGGGGKKRRTSGSSGELDERRWVESQGGRGETMRILGGTLLR